MGEFCVTAKIEGTAICWVEAENAEAAVKLARASGAWELDQWDLNTQPWKGGYIEAQDCS